MCLQRQSPLGVIKLKLATTIAKLLFLDNPLNITGLFWNDLHRGYGTVQNLVAPKVSKSFIAHLHIAIFDIPITFLYKSICKIE